MGQKVEARFGKEAAAPPPVAPVPTPKQEPPPQQEPPQQPAPADEGTKKHSNVFSEPESWTPIAIGLGAAGVGLVGAILFAVFKADAQQKADSVASTIRTEANARGIQSQGICNNTASNPDFAKACNTLRDNNSKVDTDATIANVSLVVMGVGLLTAGIWYLAGPKKDDAKSSSKTFFTPYADGHGGGFMTVGRF